MRMEYFVIFILCVLLIWAFIKLRKANSFNKYLSKENNSLKKRAKEQENKIDSLQKENSLLIADNALLEAEQLKFQLQPHTLGNVVATLNSIAKNLHRGTESLAESLNYILYKGNAHLVSVEDEISFVKKYIQLNKLLYSDILSINLDESRVDAKSRYFVEPSIPHLISAYLIENAYKHGDKVHPEFLKIHIQLTDSFFELTVANQIKVKTSEQLAGGIGLKNMRKRLELLHTNKYEIKNSCTENVYYASLTIRF